MKQLTEEQKGYVFRTLQPRAEAIMNLKIQRPDLCWDTNIEELALIKTIFEDMIGEIVDEREEFKELETKDECVQFLNEYLERNTLCTLDLTNFKNLIKILKKK